MAVKNDREYRAMQIERRELEEGQEPDFKVAGYASTFNEYKLFSFDGVDYCERIEPTAFDEADLSDVIFLYNHEGMVYARQKNGTLELSMDEHGLHSVADLSKTAAARELYDSIQAGMIDQMSFAFTVAEDRYDNEPTKCVRVIKRIGKVYDVSAVSIPANPGTDISAVSARSAFDGEIEKRTAERLEAERALALAKAKYEFMEV